MFLCDYQIRHQARVHRYVIQCIKNVEPAGVCRPYVKTLLFISYFDRQTLGPRFCVPLWPGNTPENTSTSFNVLRMTHQEVRWDSWVNKNWWYQFWREASKTKLDLCHMSKDWWKFCFVEGRRVWSLGYFAFYEWVQTWSHWAHVLVIFFVHVWEKDWYRSKQSSRAPAFVGLFFSLFLIISRCKSHLLHIL